MYTHTHSDTTHKHTHTACYSSSENLIYSLITLYVLLSVGEYLVVNRISKQKRDSQKHGTDLFQTLNVEDGWDGGDHLVQCFVTKAAQARRKGLAHGDPAPPWEARSPDS